MPTSILVGCCDIEYYNSFRDSIRIYHIGFCDFSTFPINALFIIDRLRYSDRRAFHRFRCSLHIWIQITKFNQSRRGHHCFAQRFSYDMCMVRIKHCYTSNSRTILDSLDHGTSIMIDVTVTYRITHTCTAVKSTLTTLVIIRPRYAQSRRHYTHGYHRSYVCCS